ncbi:MAG TPA: hypothetical protein DEP84_37815, partial [Chloroflexi bacterium]|nr:hypothetical protein [Chloroflexota bacterium]
LGTPTATPPAWLTWKYPECLRVDERGRRMSPQTRRHACANNHDYRRLALRITEKIAERYGRDERVVAWQIDNEYGCHETIRCTCPNCEREFQRWLEAHYGSPEALNAAWGTTFWSQRYTDWRQVLLPGPAPADHSPGLMLDFYRFSSDTWVRFNHEEAAILRRHAPTHQITHNLMIYFFQFDHYELAKDLDFVSWDNYHHHGAQPVTIAANHAIIWGMKEQNFWVIEQQAGQVNWSAYNPQFPPGLLSLKVMQAIAHGADAILYFRWRQARHGAELYHSGLLDHAARPTRAYSEVLALATFWQRAGPALSGNEPHYDAAILFDFASHWALEYQPHTRSLDFRAPSDEPLLFAGGAPLQAMNRWGLYLLPIYEALWRHNLQAAIISPGGMLNRYKVVFAPQLHVTSQAHAARLQAWVEAGGTLVVGPRAGFKNEAGALHDVPQPGPLVGLIGGTVREFDTREPGDTIPLNLLPNPSPDEREELRAGVWCEIWEPDEGTEVLATYGGAFFAGRPAILRKRHGRGQVITLGTMGGWPLIAHLLPSLGLEAPLITPPNVEAARRGDLLFLLNHNPVPHEVVLPEPWADVGNGQEERTVHLEGYGWRLLRRAAKQGLA